MRNVRLATCVLLLLASGSPGLHASGFENTGLGTTARGMGGAFRAIANDWTAAYYNPAGYAFVIDNQMGSSVGLIHHRNGITPDYAASDGYINNGEPNKYGWGIVNGQTVYNFHQILNNPAGGFLTRMQFWGETVLGISIYQPFDNNIAWRFYSPAGSSFRAYNDDLSLIPKDHYKNDLDVVAFQLSAGREFIEDKLALGVGLQLLRADLLFSDLTFRSNPRGYPLNRRPYDRIPEFTKNEGHGWGFGLRGGMLWKYSEKLNFAVTAYLPFDVTVNGATYFTYIMPKDDYTSSQVGISPEDYLFTAGTAELMYSDFTSKLKLPASAALGAAFQLTEKLTLSADAEYTLWSDYDGLKFDYSNFQGLPTHITAGDLETDFFTEDLSNPVEWENAGKVMLGAAYYYNHALTVLGGVSADQSPSRNSEEITPQFVDTGDKYSFNVGALFHINLWDLGIVASYIDCPDLSISGLTDPNEDGMFDSFPGDYKAETYETVLSVSRRF